MSRKYGDSIDSQLVASKADFAIFLLCCRPFSLLPPPQRLLSSSVCAFEGYVEYVVLPPALEHTSNHDEPAPREHEVSDRAIKDDEEEAEMEEEDEDEDED